MFVAPIAAKKSMSNLSGLNLTWVFMLTGSQVPWEILKYESDRSGGNRGNIDQSIVRG